MSAAIGREPGVAGAFDSLTGRGGGAPWGGNAAGSDLARDAGLDDIGGAARGSASGGGAQRAGLFDQPQDDSDGDFDDDDDDDGDDGGYDGGDTDEA